jgi:RNA polymerase sigma-54 factor
MRLEDISRITKLDPSTISRVCNSKYVDTPYGIRPLKWFFTTAVHNSDDDTTTRQVRNALKEIIDSEDKHSPLGDDQIATQLNNMGYDVARRTVSKYREQMGIPTSRMRKI